MNSSETTVLYLGHDKGFFDNLELFSRDLVKTSALMVQNFEEGSLCRLVKDGCFKLIYIDFTTVDLNIESLLEEVIYLKRMFQFRSILFVGLFDGHDAGSFNPLIFISGFQFSYIKGCDEDLMFRDTFSIVFSLGNTAPSFAQAKNIFKMMKVGIASSLNSLGTHSFALETDVSPTELSLNLSLANSLPELNCQSFEIQSSSDSGKTYPMLYSHELSLPVGSPWDEDTSKVIQEESQRNWLVDNHEKQKKNKHFVKVISKNLELIPDLFEFHCKSLFTIDHSEFLPVEDLPGQISARRPDLVFVDLELEADNTIDFLEVLLNQVKSMSDYRPVIIIANTPSSGPALQKLFAYSYILATKDSLNVDFIKSFVLSYEMKKSISKSFDCHVFNSIDERRYVDVFHELRLHSLSEHEVTFNSKLEIPMFSVLHFKMPLDFFATLVPVQNSGSSGMYFFKAIIHGLSEKKLEILRKFVNRIISNPLKDLSEEHIREVLSSMEDRPTVQEKIHLLPESKEVEVPAMVEKVVVKKIKFSLYAGKSKL